MRTLSHQEARRTYDRIGARQDTQAFYEDVATREVIRHGDFASALAVFEFGCGYRAFRGDAARRSSRANSDLPRS